MRQRRRRCQTEIRSHTQTGPWSYWATWRRLKNKFLYAK